MSLPGLKKGMNPLSFLATMIIAIPLFFVTFNIGASMLDFEISDTEEFSAFKNVVDTSRPGRVNAFSFHSVPEGAEFVVLMDSPRNISVTFTSLDNVASAEVEGVGRWWRYVPIANFIQTGEIEFAAIVFDFISGKIEEAGLNRAEYLASPTGCSEDSSCVCIFRGVDDRFLDEEGVIYPRRSTCGDLDLDFRGDSITVLSNREDFELGSENIGPIREGYIESPAIIDTDTGEPLTSDIKLFHNVRKDSNLLTVRIIREESFFVACIDRYHCEEQYEKIMGGDDIGQTYGH